MSNACLLAIVISLHKTNWYSNILSYEGHKTNLPNRWIELLDAYEIIDKEGEGGLLRQYLCKTQGECLCLYIRHLGQCMSYDIDTFSGRSM